MTSFFGNALGGNPFSTPVGSRIEQATDGSLASENWGLNMEICDLINETEDGPKDAIKAIKKRLFQNAGKNYTVVMYTLTVLETCVKNCGKRFHLLTCNKDFVQELVKLIGPKNDPPTAVQEKVLSLIQSWADAFRQQQELAGVVAVYQDLVNKGIEFPATDLDSMAPIITPQRSVESTAGNVGGSLEPQIISQPTVQEPPAIMGNLTLEQRAKLQSELDVVQSNMAVFGEMLTEMKPGDEHLNELELLQELNATCHSMQDRLVELINKLPSDELTAEFLRVNDDLNNLFLRYSRWEKNREAGGQSASAVLAKAIGPNVKAQTASKNNDSLIDLDIPEKFNKMSVSSTVTPEVQTHTVKTKPVGDDEFDMFAQSRKATYETSKTSGSTYKDNLEPDQVPGGLSTLTQSRQITSDSDFDEMAAWLHDTRSTTEEAVTSSEFEKFLAERAAAADSLPSVPTVTTSSTGTSVQATQKSAKDNKKEHLLA